MNRDGNNVKYDIENLTSRYDGGGGEVMVRTAVRLVKELAQS